MQVFYDECACTYFDWIEIKPSLDFHLDLDNFHQMVYCILHMIKTKKINTISGPWSYAIIL